MFALKCMLGFILQMQLLQTCLTSNKAEVLFIIGEYYESHVEACRRHDMHIYNQREIPWSLSMLTTISHTLQRKVPSSPLQGCCSAGVWCDQHECFTHSLTGYFENIGPIFNDSSHLPVYTCERNYEIPFYTMTNIQDSIDNSNTTLTITTPSNINLGVYELSMYTNAKKCRNTELCSQSCTPCLYSTDCPLGSICIGDGIESYCFLNCGGPTDTSCPCDQQCNVLPVTTMVPSNGIFPTYLYNSVMVCSEYTFNSSTKLSNGACNGSISTVKMQCMPDKSFIASSRDSSTNITADLKTSHSHHIIDQMTGSSSLILTTCIHDEQCSDGNVCTIDQCNHGQCIFLLTDPKCKTISPHLSENISPFSYFIVKQANMQLEHTSFAKQMETHGKISPASNRFNFPLDYLVFIDFSFLYFGNIINGLAINPNGVLHLPPYLDCRGPINTVQCILYSTFTNTISIWASHWAAPFSTKPAISYYLQKPNSTNFGDENEKINGAFHIIYKDINKLFRESYRNGSTFSTTIYGDGSIKMRYHTVDTDVDIADTFGIWGAKASQVKYSSLIRNNFNVSLSHISSGSDLIYCPYSTVTCPVSACVSPSVPLQLQWSGFECRSFMEDISFVCKWSDGSVSSAEVLLPDQNRNTAMIVCAVPLLQFVMDGDLVTVQIEPVVLDMESIILEQMVLMGMTYSMSELTRHNIIVRYYSTAVPESCTGCSPVRGASLQCDRCGVCGGNTTTVDCNGDCFGSAYIDAIGICARGRTGNIPVYSVHTSADFGGGLRDYLSAILSWLIILGVFGCLSCCSTLCFLAVRLVVLRSMGRDINGGLEEGIFVTDRNRNQPPLPRPRRQGLTVSQIESIGDFVFRRLDADDPLQYAECSICLSPLEHLSVCRRLPAPCEHVFHKECIDSWLKQANICPVCRRAVDTTSPQSDSDSEGASLSEQSTTSSDQDAVNALPTRDVRGRRYVLVRSESLV